jgi:hypothetical protein
MGELRSSWEQLEGESAKAFKAFVCYLEMPAKTRSVIAAYLAYSGRREAKNKLKTPGFFNDWASKNQWRKRAKAFDEHQLNERLAGVADVRKKALVVAWDAIVETIESQQANLDTMDAAEKSRWIAVLSGVVKLQQEGDIPNLDDYIPTPDDEPHMIEVGPDGVVQ